jgi:hypothetical protein
MRIGILNAPDFQQNVNSEWARCLRLLLRTRKRGY